MKEALDNAENKANKKAQHIESLVRMLFLQKSERFILTDEEREPLLEAAANSVDLTAEEKAELNACNRRIAEFRQRKRDARHPRSQGVTWSWASRRICTVATTSLLTGPASCTLCLAPARCLGKILSVGLRMC